MTYIVKTKSFTHYFKCCEIPNDSPQWKFLVIFFNIFELLWWSCYLCKVRKAARTKEHTTETSTKGELHKCGDQKQ